MVAALSEVNLKSDNDGRSRSVKFCPGVTMRFLCSFLISLTALPLAAQDPAASPQPVAANVDVIAPYQAKAKGKWAQSIAAFDQQNLGVEQSPDSVLFIGSSSIRRWSTMATDLVPYRTIRRGYGGAKFTDMGVFVNQLVSPHQYRALVMFVGNGVVGEPTDHTPDQIEELARYIVSVSHSHQPGSPVFLIEITPCEKRFAAWSKIRAVNARLREVALSTPDTYFIPTASHYLKADGTPRPELFVADKLHLSESGYQLWSSLIRKRLDDVLRSMANESDQKAAAAAAKD